MIRIASTAMPRMAQVVRDHAEEGNKLARAFAKASAGPHGKSYYKRISAEAITPLEWEYGPSEVDGRQYVGAGYRNSAPNTDLPKSADLIGPKFADAVGDMADGLFW